MIVKIVFFRGKDVKFFEAWQAKLNMLFEIRFNYSVRLRMEECNELWGWCWDNYIKVIERAFSFVAWAVRYFLNSGHRLWKIWFFTCGSFLLRSLLSPFSFTVFGAVSALLTLFARLAAVLIVLRQRLLFSPSLDKQCSSEVWLPIELSNNSLYTLVVLEAEEGIWPFNSEVIYFPVWLEKFFQCRWINTLWDITDVN